MKIKYATGLVIIFLLSFGMFLIVSSWGRKTDYTPASPASLADSRRAGGPGVEPFKRPIPSIKDIVSSKLPDIPEKKPSSVLILDKLFDQDVSQLDQYDQKHFRTLVSGGDVIPARTANANAVRANDFTWSYRNIAPYFKSADLAVINFETPLLKNCPVTDVGMIFCGTARQAEGLSLLGLDVVGLANNHASNYGQAGLDETTTIFRNLGADVVGRGQPVIKDVDGVQFGFLAYNDITGGAGDIADADIPRVIQDVQTLRKRVDVLIVLFHWGDEYTRLPNQRQVLLAHTAVDSGADLIIGNHPHWIQKAEVYKNKFISYAWGNMVFDQMWSEETKKGMIAEYYFYDADLVDIKLVPVYIENYGQPKVVADPIIKNSILKSLIH